jgi:P27 family predicted phage terminase small subunit
MKNSIPSSSLPKPPRRLSREAGEWWKKINEGWQLDDAALLLLGSALECFDRMREAQGILAREGIVVKDRFGQKKQHPATLIERDAKMAMVRSLRALNLDIEPLNLPGRPPGRK